MRRHGSARWRSYSRAVPWPLRIRTQVKSETVWWYIPPLSPAFVCKPQQRAGEKSPQLLGKCIDEHGHLPRFQKTYFQMLKRSEKNCVRIYVLYASPENNDFLGQYKNDKRMSRKKLFLVYRNLSFLRRQNKKLFFHKTLCCRNISGRCEHTILFRIFYTI